MKLTADPRTHVKDNIAGDRHIVPKEVVDERQTGRAPAFCGARAHDERSVAHDDRVGPAVLPGALMPANLTGIAVLQSERGDAGSSQDAPTERVVKVRLRTVPEHSAQAASRCLCASETLTGRQRTPQTATVTPAWDATSVHS